MIQKVIIFIAVIGTLGFSLFGFSPSEVVIYTEPEPLEESWGEFSRDDENFLARFPEVPAESISLLPGDALDAQIFSYRASQEQTAFVLAYQSMESTGSDQVSQRVEDVFRAACRSAALELSGELKVSCNTLLKDAESWLVAKESLGFDRLARWEAHFLTPETPYTPAGVGFVQTIVADGRLYQLVVVGPQRETTKTEAESFFSSFSVAVEPTGLTEAQ